MNKTDYKDMWVFIERDGDSVLPVSLELCSETRRLCDASGEKLVAVIVGSISDGELQRVLDCGVDKVIHVTGTGYDYFNNDAYTNLFTVLCRKYRPTAVMVGGTINGRDFAPRFAARLGTGCTSDATELVWDPKTTDIEFVEPAVGGKMMAVITVPVARPQVGTIRPGTFKCVPCGARAHEVIEEHIDFPVADIRTEILDFRADDLDESLNIADADVIVCVGNAIKGRTPCRAIAVWQSASAARSPARARCSTAACCRSSSSSGSPAPWSSRSCCCRSVCRARSTTSRAFRTRTWSSP